MFPVMMRFVSLLGVAEVWLVWAEIVIYSKEIKMHPLVVDTRGGVLGFLRRF